MSKVDRKFVLSDLREEYLTLLAPAFSQHVRVDTTEYVFALIRAGGLQDAGWDPLEESRSFVNDLAGLMQSDELAGRFTDPETTSPRRPRPARCGDRWIPARTRYALEHQR